MKTTFSQFLNESQQVKFNIHEIEHSGDADDSVADLKSAGCTNIKVLATNYDQEFMTVSCTLPPDIDPKSGWQQQLQAKLKFAAL